MEKFETIQAWLKEDPVNYDFVEDTVKDPQGENPRKDDSEIDPIEKFLIYKYTGGIDWSIIDCVDPKKKKGTIYRYR